MFSMAGCCLDDTDELLSFRVSSCTSCQLSLLYLVSCVELLAGKSSRLSLVHANARF